MKRALRFAAIGFFFAAFNLSAQAATITVAPGAVAAVSGDHTCSLIEAIQNAEAHSDTSGGDCVAGTVGSNTIVLAANSIYSLTAAYSPMLDHLAGLPTIRSTTTINGNGSTIQRDPSLYTTTVCSGGGAQFRILYVAGDGDLTINNLTLQNGCDGGYSGGGGIRNHGILSLINTTVTNNETTQYSGSGGGIFNTGTLTLTLSTVSNTTAAGAGGSIENQGTLTVTQSTVSGGNAGAASGGIDNYGTLNITQSTISGNNATGSGGGISNYYSSTAIIANSTLSGNRTDGLGGALYITNDATLLNSTFAYNRGTQFAGAPGLGSGIFSLGYGTVTMKNTLFAQQLNGTNCSLSGVVVANKNVADDATCGVAPNAAPQVAALADNGGPTLTHALLAGSAAIDAGDATTCSNAPVSGVDQRGVTRPRNGGISNTCDIGAVEANYGVVYNGNGNTGGNVPVDGNFYANGATVTVLGNTGALAETGYGFTGWNTAANGSGTSRAPASPFPMGAGLVMLYAQWSPSVNGTCGSASGTPVSVAPIANLCSAGNSSSVTLANGAYGWSCAGSNGGATASCSASLLVDGACGSASGTPVSVAPIANLCSAGNSSGVTLANGAFGWSCAGSNGGATASCSASLLVNGACGSASGTTVAFAPIANLCIAGNSAGVTSGNGAYGWSCTGSNGGTTASCSASGQTTGTGTGAGTATVATNGWVFAPQGSGPLQTSGFIPTSGDPKSPPNLPQGYSFPQGLFDFVLTTGTPGSSATITITYPNALPPGTVYWKYGPSPDGNNCIGAACTTPHWYQFPAVIAGNTVTLTITDGGLGDDDLMANGTIVDQGGPGVPPTVVPTLNEWGLILLSCLLALGSLVALRRQRQ